MAEAALAFPPFVCTACRDGEAAHHLDADLRCPNPACRERYEYLEDSSVPVLLPPALRERTHESDAPGALVPPGQVGAYLRSVRPGTPAFAPLSRAAIFLRAMRECAEEPFYADLCDALLPALPAPLAIADLGCGAGNLAFELARRLPVPIVAVDLDAHLLRWAERAATWLEFEAPVRIDAGRFAASTMRVKGGFESESVRFVCANLLDPPFAGASFDLVTLSNVLDALPYPGVALRQAVALLKPGGHLLFASPDSWNGATTPVNRWLATTEAGWDRVFARAGLESVRRVDDLEWRLQDSPRLHHLYRVHGQLLRKV